MRLLLPSVSSYPVAVGANQIALCNLFKDILPTMRPNHFRNITDLFTTGMIEVHNTGQKCLAAISTGPISFVSSQPAAILMPLSFGVLRSLMFVFLIVRRIISLAFLAAITTNVSFTQMPMWAKFSCKIGFKAITQCVGPTKYLHRYLANEA